jgi:DNA mismatch repair protein MutS
MASQIANPTPMMAQWHQCKGKSKDCLLLFRMGDFYEAFYEDAKILAEALDINLTKRQEIPMSGIPHHALQNYLDRLLVQGHKVAIAEQTEDPKKAKGLVAREVVRIITPGTLIDSNLLDANAPNYLVCLSRIGCLYGLAYIDISTSDFRVFESPNIKEITEELYRIKPAEIVLTSKLELQHQEIFQEMKRTFNFSISPLEEWHFDPQMALDLLIRHFKVHSLDGFGLKGMTAAINSAGALLHYLEDTLCHSISHIQSLKKVEERDYLVLDHITLRHLEIVEPQSALNKDQTLLYHLNHTQTPMGARLLRDWVQKPLVSQEKIHARQDAIEDLLQHPYVLLKIKESLKNILDLERLIMRVVTDYTNPKELNTLKNSLSRLPHIKQYLSELNTSFFSELQQKLPLLTVCIEKIENALREDCPLKLGEGYTFNSGYNAELDEWLNLNSSSKEWIANYQARVRQETQIKTLKVGYNRVFGYYIEVSKGQASAMPDHFHRRQTLANNERFISEELKSYESKIFQAEEKVASLEQELFEQLKEQVSSFKEDILSAAQIIAQIDTLLSFALVAQKHHYIKPLVDNSSTLKISQGCHPILDRLCSFIPNDTFLDQEKNKLALITGPNMAGKSTYIRQVALLVILAQLGSYLPAQSAHIGIVDRIFSRIGASDDLARGQSTFMVEMVETANILNNISDKSLVILDEIGRGTSTYDGIAIAQSTAQYLLRTQAKTLFATHYSELTKLSETYEGAVNYTVSVHESNDRITFLYKIIQGSTDKSYGIHVAELAGLPPSLIQEAKKILSQLEETKPEKAKKKNINQITFFDEEPKESPILQELRHLDLNRLSPMEALLKLSEYKNKLNG